MIELDGMDEDQIKEVMDDLANYGRHVAFAGAKILSEGGMGNIQFPLTFGPVFRSKHIATVGAPYSVPKEDLGSDCCPHFSAGVIETGAEDVVYQGEPVVMVGDRGKHWPTCGGGVGIVVEGWRKVYSIREIYSFAR